MKHLEFAENEVKEHLEEFYKRFGNIIEFKIQDGAIKDFGKNGLQVTDILAYITEVYKSLNDEFPCKESEMTIHHLERALVYQELRTMNRVVRGVEGHDLL